MKITVKVQTKHADAVKRALGTTPAKFPSLREARIWAHNADLFASASCGQAVTAALIYKGEQIRI